jgi:type I restriction enzyme M protein
MTNKSLPPKVRRTALQVLSRTRLAAITEQFNLPVKDRRAAAAYVNAIIRARSIDFGEVLRLFQRDELKASCVALALDPAGREKETIVQRILAA